MSINIKVIEEDGTLVKYFKYIEAEDIFVVTKLAETLPIKCLSFIDPADTTTFNEGQVRYIKKEIEMLRNHKEVNQQMLNLIEEACDEVLKENYQYVVFVGD